MFGHIFGELLAVTIPFGTSYLVTQYLPFAPLFPPGSSIPSSASFLPNAAIEFARKNNDIAISLIPSIIYLIGRIYFEAMLLISSLLPHSTAGKFSISSSCWFPKTVCLITLRHRQIFQLFAYMGCSDWSLLSSIYSITHHRCV